MLGSISMISPLSSLFSGDPRSPRSGRFPLVGIVVPNYFRRVLSFGKLNMLEYDTRLYIEVRGVNHAHHAVYD